MKNVQDLDRDFTMLRKLVYWYLCVYRELGAVYFDCIFTAYC